MVARFERSAASKEVNKPEKIRPTMILYETVSYLRDCVMDQDSIPAGESIFKYKGEV